MTMALQPYPEYKDSGLPWLSRVPTHWRMATLRRVADVQLSNVDKHSFQGEQPVRLCNYTDVYYHRYITPDMDFMKATALPREIEKFELRRGDVLITKDSEDWQDIAVPALVTEDMPGILCGYHLAHIKPWADELHGDYLMWACRSEPVALQFRTAANGVTRYAVSGPDIKGGLIPLPPLDEQYAIGRYLRSIERRVNRFIRNRRRLIEVLNEQKQAIINRAVTCGLDPNAPLKPSGIDWLDDIPEHWEVRRLKHLLSQPLKYGANAAAELTDRSLPRYIRITDIDKTGRLIDDRFRSIRPELAAPYMLHDGDILLARSGATVGKAFLYSSEAGPAAHAGYLIKARVNRSRILPAFLYAVLQSAGYWRWIASMTIQATIQNVNAEKYANLWVTVPPLEEQQQILGAIDRDISVLSGLIDKAKREIALIREYRTRLIADVVTGKLDVRDLAPTPGDEIIEAVDLDEGIDDEEMLWDDEPELVEEVIDADD